MMCSYIIVIDTLIKKEYMQRRDWRMSSFRERFKCAVCERVLANRYSDGATGIGRKGFQVINAPKDWG